MKLNNSRKIELVTRLMASTWALESLGGETPRSECNFLPREVAPYAEVSEFNNWIDQIMTLPVEALYMGYGPELIHANYVKFRKEDGWVVGYKCDRNLKTSDMIKPWPELDKQYQYLFFQLYSGVVFFGRLFGEE